MLLACISIRRTGLTVRNRETDRDKNKNHLLTRRGDKKSIKHIDAYTITTREQMTNNYNIVDRHTNIILCSDNNITRQTRYSRDTIFRSVNTCWRPIMILCEGEFV